MENLIDVAEIVNTHGLRGEVKVSPRTDYIEFFEEIEGVYTKDGTFYKIKSVKYHKASAILKLEGIDNVDDANKMRQQVLYVEKSLFDSLPEGTYLVADIIGLLVKDEKVSYGYITDVFQTGSNDVYTVEKKGSQPIYLPALKTVIKEVNLKNGYMLVEIPEGLLD